MKLNCEFVDYVLATGTPKIPLDRGALRNIINGGGDQWSAELGADREKCEKEDCLDNGTPEFNHFFGFGFIPTNLLCLPESS